MMQDEEYDDMPTGVITRAAAREKEELEKLTNKELQCRKLKYSAPHLRDLKDVELREDFKDFFIKMMDPSLMDDELKEYWADDMQKIVNKSAAVETVNAECTSVLLTSNLLASTFYFNRIHIGN